MSEPADQPPARRRAARWLLNAEGPDSPESARRNAVFVSLAAGVYAYLIAGGLPPRDWIGYGQVIVALLLVLAALNSWRAYRKVLSARAQSVRPHEPPADDDHPL